MAHGWTPERKKKQAELIRLWQPWKQSTGAKTLEGKAKSAQNAFKGGVMHQIKLLERELKLILKKQHDQLNKL